MTTIVIVQCGMRKSPRPAMAKDLYVGSYFRFLRKTAIRIADRWYIVSAKHGLISPTKVIAPYDQTLPSRGDPAWGSRVLSDLREREPAGWDRIIALCSRRYLLGWAEEVGAEVPFEGLRIGESKHRACGLRRIR